MNFRGLWDLGRGMHSTECHSIELLFLSVSGLSGPSLRNTENMFCFTTSYFEQKKLPTDTLKSGLVHFLATWGQHNKLQAPERHINNF